MCVSICRYWKGLCQSFRGSARLSEVIWKARLAKFLSQSVVAKKYISQVSKIWPAVCLENQKQPHGQKSNLRIASEATKINESSIHQQGFQNLPGRRLGGGLGTSIHCGGVQEAQIIETAPKFGPQVKSSCFKKRAWKDFESVFTSKPIWGWILFATLTDVAYQKRSKIYDKQRSLFCMTCAWICAFNTKDSDGLARTKILQNTRMAANYRLTVVEGRLPDTKTWHSLCLPCHAPFARTELPRNRTLSKTLRETWRTLSNRLRKDCFPCQAWQNEINPIKGWPWQNHPRHA